MSSCQLGPSGYCRISQNSGFQATFLLPCSFQANMSQIDILNYGIIVSFGSVAHKFNCLNYTYSSSVAHCCQTAKRSLLCVDICVEKWPGSTLLLACRQKNKLIAHFDWQVGLIDGARSAWKRVVCAHVKEGEEMAGSIRGEIGVPDWPCCCFVLCRQRRIFSPHHGTPGGHILMPKACLGHCVPFTYSVKARSHCKSCQS